MELTPKQYEKVKDLLLRRHGNVKMNNLDVEFASFIQFALVFEALERAQ